MWVFPSVFLIELFCLEDESPFKNDGYPYFWDVNLIDFTMQFAESEEFMFFFIIEPESARNVHDDFGLIGIFDFVSLPLDFIRVS